MTSCIVQGFRSLFCCGAGRAEVSKNKKQEKIIQLIDSLSQQSGHNFSHLELTEIQKDDLKELNKHENWLSGGNTRGGIYGLAIVYKLKHRDYPENIQALLAFAGEIGCSDLFVSSESREEGYLNELKSSGTLEKKSSSGVYNLSLIRQKIDEHPNLANQNNLFSSSDSQTSTNGEPSSSPSSITTDNSVASSPNGKVGVASTENHEIYPRGNVTPENEAESDTGVFGDIGNHQEDMRKRHGDKASSLAGAVGIRLNMGYGAPHSGGLSTYDKGSSDNKGVISSTTVNFDKWKELRSKAVFKGVIFDFSRCTEKQIGDFMKYIENMTPQVLDRRYKKNEEGAKCKILLTRENISKIDKDIPVKSKVNNAFTLEIP